MKRVLPVAVTVVLLAALVFAGSSTAQPPLKGSEALKVALNQVAALNANKDLTFKATVHPGLLEIKRKHGIQALTGLRIPPNIGPLSEQRMKLVAPRLRSDPPPKNFDVRKEIAGKHAGKVLTVQNQLSCGSCWVFSAIGSYEVNYLYQGTLGANVDAAEQHPLSCLAARGIGNCQSGGWPADTFEFLIKEGTGARSDPAMRYQAQNGVCIANPRITFKAVEWGYVEAVDPGGRVPSTENIKAAIHKYGSVTAAVFATDAMTNYDSGVFNFNEVGRVNHAIAIVGWETLNDGKVAWIVRNSWGDDYGEDGHIRIREGVNSIGFGAMWVSAQAGSGPGPGPGPDDRCPCPPSAPSYNAEVRQRIDFWMNRFPQFGFPR